MNSTTFHPPEYVLVKADHRGCLEIYSTPNTRIRVLQQPAVESAAGELMCEQYIDAQLPKPFRDIHFPGSLRDIFQVEYVTPTEVAFREGVRELYDKIDAIAGDAEEVVTWVV